MGEFRYQRVPLPEESKDERMETFGEVLQSYTPEEAVLEASRCLQCAMPYCVQACPINQDCRGYIGLIAQGKFDDAAALTLRENPLATVLCKTCYHYCEEDCIMGGRGVPIAIRHLKRAALELGESDLLYVASAPKNERVAIVGGGPTGLMAAWELGARGYGVTVYEMQPFLGGQVDTIPKYHLAEGDLDIDLARFKNLDVTFVTGKKVGADFTPERLLQDGYLAVLVAVGASDPRALGVPGEHFPGVFPALPFLLGLNKGPEGSLFGRKNRNVVVVGGGDVALDAARSSERLTSDGGSVTVAYRKGREEMPAGDEEVEGGLYEGVRILYESRPAPHPRDGPGRGDRAPADRPRSARRPGEADGRRRPRYGGDRAVRHGDCRGGRERGRERPAHGAPPQPVGPSLAPGAERGLDDGRRRSVRGRREVGRLCDGGRYPGRPGDRCLHRPQEGAAPNPPAESPRRSRTASVPRRVRRSDLASLNPAPAGPGSVSFREREPLASPK